MDAPLTAAEIRSYADRLLGAEGAGSAAELIDLIAALEQLRSGHHYLATAPAPPGWREPRFVKVGPGRYELIA